MSGHNPTHWWWNGRWGRLARKDIKIFAQGAGRFRLEVWEGGVEGKVHEYPDLDETAALQLARDQADQVGREALGDWRDMAGTLRN